MIWPRRPLADPQAGSRAIPPGLTSFPHSGSMPGHLSRPQANTAKSPTRETGEDDQYVRYAPLETPCSGAFPGRPGKWAVARFQIQGAASHHAKWRQLTETETAAAVAG